MVLALLALLLMLVPATANEKGMMKNPCEMGGKMMNPCEMQGKMGKREMKHEMMEIMKESLIIQRNMSHKPNAEQKQNLDEMIERLEKMLEKGKAMH